MNTALFEIPTSDKKIYNIKTGQERLRERQDYWTWASPSKADFKTDKHASCNNICTDEEWNKCPVGANPFQYLNINLVDLHKLYMIIDLFSSFGNQINRTVFDEYITTPKMKFFYLFAKTGKHTLKN